MVISDWHTIIYAGDMTQLVALHALLEVQASCFINFACQRLSTCIPVWVAMRQSGLPFTI
jgi:hypothetical protein